MPVGNINITETLNDLRVTLLVYVSLIFKMSIFKNLCQYNANNNAIMIK